MIEYIHDEWCATVLDGAEECDCYAHLLEEKDAEIERYQTVLYEIYVNDFLPNRIMGEYGISVDHKDRLATIEGSE